MDNAMSLDVACKAILMITPEEYRKMAKAGYYPHDENGNIDILRACKSRIEYYDFENIEKVCQDYFGISSRRYRQMADEDILDKPDNGFVDIKKNQTKLIKHQRTQIVRGNDGTLIAERIRLTSASAGKKEVELEKMKGEIIETEKAMQLWGKIIMTIKQKLTAIPVKLAPMILSCRKIPEAKKIIEEFIYEVLNELSNPDLRELSRVDNNPRDNVNVSPPTKTNSKRVGGRKKTTKF